MHLGIETLAGFFRRHRGHQPMVLATVVTTTGSTYRKPGAMMLLARDGSFAGMISGGCLEGDLAQRAMRVFETGQAAEVHYDLEDDPELVWGLGLGCGGSVRLLLTRLDPGAGEDALAGLFDALDVRDPCTLALVQGGGSGDPETGAVAARSCSGKRLGDRSLQRALDALNLAAEPPRAELHTLPDDEAGKQILVVRIEPPPRVLICGAGPDAVPVAQAVRSLGWECVVVDHRPEHARTDRFPPGTHVLCQRPGEIEADLCAATNAAIVMSHHVEHDQAYLRQLVGLDLPYLGLLGPARRREELTSRLPGTPKLRGPAGLDIGAELPEAIALSIVAEIHAVLNGRAGGALSHE